MIRLGPVVVFVAIVLVVWWIVRTERPAMGRPATPVPPPPRPTPEAYVSGLVDEAHALYARAVKQRDRALSIEPIGPSHVQRREASLALAAETCAEAETCLRTAAQHLEAGVASELVTILDGGGDAYERVAIAFTVV